MYPFGIHHCICDRLYTLDDTLYLDAPSNQIEAKKTWGLFFDESMDQSETPTIDQLALSYAPQRHDIRL